MQMDQLSSLKDDTIQGGQNDQPDELHKKYIALRLCMALMSETDLRVPYLKISPRYSTSGNSTGIRRFSGKMESTGKLSFSRGPSLIKR